MPRPAVLSRPMIAAAALALIDRDGLASLSMRSLGRELDVAAMSLYNHVADREALEGLVAEAVVADIDTTARHADPLDDVRGLMIDLRGALDAHPAAIPLVLRRPTVSPVALAPIEALLAALDRAGFAGMDLLHAYRTLFAFLVGSAQTALVSPVPSGGGPTLSGVIDGVRGLPAADFVHLRACAEIAAGSDPAAEFEHGLAVIVRGLVERRSAGAAPGAAGRPAAGRSGSAT